MVRKLFQEDQRIVSVNAGHDLFMRNMRKVLERRGYHGQQLEARISKLLQKDVSKLAAIIARPRKE